MDDHGVGPGNPRRLRRQPVRRNVRSRAAQPAVRRPRDDVRKEELIQRHDRIATGGVYTVFFYAGGSEAASSGTVTYWK